MKAGQIIQNEQGRFAKIIEIKGSRFGLSAWVNKKEQAENEKVVVRFLNSFGITQVIKDGSLEAPEKPQAPRTLEEMSGKELKAIAKDYGISQGGSNAELVERITAHMQAMQAEMEDHVVTQEDLDANPELAEHDIKVGDIIQLPKGATE